MQEFSGIFLKGAYGFRKVFDMGTDMHLFSVPKEKL